MEVDDIVGSIKADGSSRPIAGSVVPYGGAGRVTVREEREREREIDREIER